MAPCERNSTKRWTRRCDGFRCPPPAACAYDALIAAIALANGLPVFTCNPADFDKIDGLEVVPVPLPEGTSS
jgi:hypothetical protein